MIVLSGNLFSLALGQTAAVSAMFFIYALRFNLVTAIVLTLLLGLVIGAVQGFAVGAWGANPIIVTIGAAGLMEGLAVGSRAGRASSLRRARRAGSTSRTRCSASPPRSKSSSSSRSCWPS